jgi:hypothetical protein
MWLLVYVNLMFIHMYSFLDHCCHLFVPGIVVLHGRWAWSRIVCHQYVTRCLADKLFQIFLDQSHVYNTQNSNKYKTSTASILQNDITVDIIKKSAM